MSSPPDFVPRTLISPPAADVARPRPISRRCRTAADDPARAIALALLDGFDHHYALFRDCARAAKRHFEAANWRAIRHVARDRIDFYDRRVRRPSSAPRASSARRASKAAAPRPCGRA